MREESKKYPSTNTEVNIKDAVHDTEVNIEVAIHYLQDFSTKQYIGNHLQIKAMRNNLIEHYYPINLLF